MPRQMRDWDGLFMEWCASSLSKSSFFKAKGINPYSGSTYTKTSDWESRRTTIELHETLKYEVNLGTSLSNKELSIEGFLASYADLKQHQPLSEYVLTARLREHIDNLLTQSWVPSETRHENEPRRSNLTPAEILQISKAIQLIQRVQRLALGVDPNRVESNDGYQDTLNNPQAAVFSVEMSENGKFKSPRPKTQSK